MDLGKLRELAIRRECKECGAVFETTKELSALEQFTDHLTEHQPTPGQWAEAYSKIRQKPVPDVKGR